VDDDDDDNNNDDTYDHDYGDYNVKIIKFLHQ
jgi:hypothetical protein